MKPLSTPILSILLAMAANSMSPAQSWVELGPAPIDDGARYTGRISAVVCSPTDAGTIYVAGADGGVWKTTNSGTNWTPLTDHLPSTAIGALALDPTDESVIYAGSGEANFANHSRYGVGLYKSTDGGATWSISGRRAFSGRCFSRILVRPDDPSTVYAAITRAGGFPELAAAKGHPRATDPIGVYRSSDGGLTWRQLTNGLPSLSATDLAIDPVTPTTLYAGIGRIFGAGQNGIYKSTDGGDSWSKLGGGLPTSDVGRIALAVAPTRARRVYALITQESSSTGGSAATRGTYRSDDFGASWTRISSENIQSSYGWYLCTTAVSPTDYNTVFIGGLVARRSRNGGSSWNSITPPHVDLHAFTFDASGRLLVGDDGGLHRSTNEGDSWSSLNEGLGLVQFYAGISLDPSRGRTVLGGTQDNGSNARLGNDLEWEQVFGGDGGWTQIDQQDPNRAFVEFQGTGNLYRSTSGPGGGYSYVGGDLGGRNAFLPPFLIDPNDSSRMIYGSHRIYRSTDGGSNWSAISGDLSNGSGAIRALAMGTDDSDVIYASTNDGNVQVSFDGGFTFQRILSGHPGWPRVTRELYVNPSDAHEMYLATATFGTTQVRRTRDGGLTWRALDAGLPDIPVNVIAVDHRTTPDTILAGTDSGVFVTFDDGATWGRYGQGLPNAAVIDLLLDTSRNRIVAATQGRGVWRVTPFFGGEQHTNRLR